MTVQHVLITGGGGFIGSHLVDHQLGLGRQVTVIDTCLDRISSRQGIEGLRLVEGDVCDTELLESIVPGTDVVFHLASAHLEVTKGDEYFQQINVTGTRNLALMSAQEGVNRFVHCSSVGVYGPLAQVPADEDTPCRPDIAYEITKLDGEKAVLAVAREEGLSTVVLRPAWVYGPGCPRTLKLFRALRKKRFFMVGKGRNLRHPVFIDDMLQAFELAATRNGIDSQIFIIASDKYVTLEELIGKILQVEDSGFKPVSVPLFAMIPVCYLVEIVAKILRREPPFSSRSLKFFTESSAFRINKAMKQLGYVPGTDLMAGLEKTRNAISTSDPA